MSKLKIAWFASLAILFAAFSFWYGGNGKPMTAAEGAAFADRLEARNARTGTETHGFLENFKDIYPRDDGKEFYAVNLETHHKGPEAEAADAKYGEIVFPALIKRGGHPVFLGDRAGLMLGKYGNDIDRVAVVRYRSLRDMVDMALDPSMEEGAVYKFAALEHSEVFIVRPTLTAVHIKLMFALILLVLAMAGSKLIDLVQTRRAD